MRLICPHCQQPVTLPDSPVAHAPGAPVPCPNCGKSITPPALTGAAIDAAPEPPPPPPVIVASRERERPEGARPPVAHAPGSPGYVPPAGRPWLHLALRRDAAHWLAPAALLLVFVLTFFTWVAVAPNGTRIYTQNAWQAAGGGFSTDVVGDRVMQAETDLRKHVGVSLWLLFFVILLIPATIVAVADRVFAHRPTSIPDILRTVWPHRQSLVAGLCLAMLIFLIAPLLTRFGLESAAAGAAEAAVPQPGATSAKPEPTTTDLAERNLRRDMEIARYGLDRTVWLKLAVFIQFLALAGIGLAWWLDRHPTAPDPRLEIYC